ncbi:hypothetical protein DU508_17535 [Pedobacter chinensis]|uniref:Uncharacterized protein n=1 Tax=Pedobacter chinensis TaxID=2282421 RepID=A0A369PVV7_9SPHI|nr:hypothetical protein [Pedobacter chinensis]RDC55375.1 hypothetical protein DU508_17535 [Pedobacter chinensis]
MKTNYYFITAILIFATLLAPAYLWASSEKSESEKYQNLQQVDYASDYYTEEAGFIAESHLTRTSHLDEGEFTEKTFFQTKFLSTPEDLQNNDFSRIINDYK